MSITFRAAIFSLILFGASQRVDSIEEAKPSVPILPHAFGLRAAPISPGTAGATPPSMIQPGGGSAVVAFGALDFPRSLYSQAFGVNDQGVIVGASGNCTVPSALSSNPPQPCKGFVLRGDEFSDLYPPGAVESSPHGVNSMGKVVGAYCLPPGCQAGHAQGYLWTGNAFVSINRPGATETRAMSINDAGEIVGYWQDTSGIHGFILRQQTSFSDLNVPGAISGTTPEGLNNRGDVVGCFSDASRVHGFAIINGALSTIDHPGATDTCLTGINDHGHMIGFWWSALPGTPTHEHGFLKIGTTFTPIDVPYAGTTGTVPSGINNKRQVVGYYGNGNGTIYALGFIFNYQ